MKIMSLGEVSSNVDTFYSESTIYVPNKYSVILYGEAVLNAISVLNNSSRSNRSSLGDSNSVHSEIDRESFLRWYGYHFNPTTSYGNGTRGALYLKWACSDVTVPAIDIMEAQSQIIMDTFKNIKFDIVTNYDSTSKLSIRVTEEKGMMWYQFFNALNNQFFNAKSLTARDSLHKLSALVVPLDTNEGASQVTTSRIGYEKLQHFEYNSIIYNGMGDSLKFSHDNESPVVYNVSFTCPNPFQSSYKKSNKGMSNKIEDSNYIFNGTKRYKENQFYAPERQYLDDEEI